MVPIRGRWHDAGVLGVPPGTPGKQAAAAFALYGLRLQSEGISPGPIEATVTIADKHGHLVGQLDLDARDAQWMVEAISWMLNRDYGRWTDEDIDRMLAEYRPAHPARHARSSPISAHDGALAVRQIPIRRGTGWEQPGRTRRDARGNSGVGNTCA